MKKKIIILTSVVMMGLALFGCGNKGDNNSDKESQKNNNEQADNNNQYVIINGKTYDLSKDSGEILQEFIDDMYIGNCHYEEEQIIRKMELNKEDEKVYYELDKDGNYVEKEQKDFDERIVMQLVSVVDRNGMTNKSIEDVCSFRIENVAYLNRPDFQMSTPSKIGIGSTTKELENEGAYKHYSMDYYYLIYLDGELVNYSDYNKEAERIQKLSDSEWAQEREKEYKYQCLEHEYSSQFNKAAESIGTEGMAYMLAKADATAKIASGEKDTMLVFDFGVKNEKVYGMAFEVFRLNELWKKSYEDFTKNK